MSVNSGKSGGRTRAEIVHHHDDREHQGRAHHHVKGELPPVPR